MLDPLCANNPVLGKRKLDVGPDDHPPAMKISPDPSMSTDPTAAPQEAATTLPEPSQAAPRRPADPWPSMSSSTTPWAKPVQSPEVSHEYKLGESSKTPFLAAQQTPCPSSPKRLRTDAFATPITPRRTKSESGHRRRRRSSRIGSDGLARLVFPDCPPSLNADNPYIPPLQPPVNRTTLKELELESILRNPQLRQSDFHTSISH
jgi:hypothetical protein